MLNTAVLATTAGKMPHRNCPMTFRCSLTFHQTHYRSYQGQVFTGQMTNQQCQSTGLLTTRLQSHQVHPTALTIIQHLCSMKQKHIKRNKSMYSKIGPVSQNPIQKTVRTAHLSVFMTVHSFSTQYDTEQF